MPIASTPREKSAAALAALGVVAGITAALVIGLRPHWQAAMRSVLVAVDMAAPAPSPTPPPPPPPPRPSAESAPKGSPAPRNLKGKASPVFAPPIAVPLVTPPPMVTSPLPALGTAAQSGTSDLAGPGTGAGGIGSGNGGGGTGGNGSGGSPVIGPRQIHGKLAYDDLPQGLVPPGAQAGVGVRYTVGVDGSVSDCRIDRTSGYAALDQAACRLIEARFRFRPARDAQRRPVPSTVAEDHVWIRAPDDN